MKKKKSSLPIAPADSQDAKARKAALNAKAKTYAASKGEKIDAINEKAKEYVKKELDVSYDNTKEGKRETWPEIIKACNDANPDKQIANGDRIVGVEAEGASVLDGKVVLEVQEDLSVKEGKTGKAEDVEAVLAKLKDEKSFTIKVERDKVGDASSPDGAELETDEEAKARLTECAKTTGGGCLKGLKAKGGAKVQAMKEKKAAKKEEKAAKKAAKDAEKAAKEGTKTDDESTEATKASDEGKEAGKGDAKEEEAAKPKEEKPAEAAKAEKSADEAKAEETKPAEGEKKE